ncbi:MAG: type III-B CRISPR-associated protein Cas10/Cmr2 [Treponema sp.]|jgi:CRISPR-associated protein Cmr2|nr:type III-B CRISPR-associated protein Cas10/Cmr2 [Treponema sp.]
MTYLAVFSITPVQAYISKARKLRDLYAGSKILSFLAGVGLKAAGEAVYPTPGSASVPNKFVFTLEAENTGAVKSHMGQIEAVIQAEWLGLAEITGVPAGLIDDYWQYSWAALPWDGKDYPKTHSRLQGLLAAAKLKPSRIRKPQQGEKCPLCGENQVWKTLTDAFGRTEKLCGVCAIKRLLPEKSLLREHALYELTVQKNFPVTTELAAHKYITENHLGPEAIDRLHNENDGRIPNIQKYYAILLMDGDKMGDLVNDKKNPQEHRELSETLDQFTGSIMIAQPGRLIYAGGDDVCAVLPLDTVLEAAKTIRERYRQFVGGTISAALLIVHHKEPLREAIRDSHTILDTISKEKAGRDALTILLRKRSGGDRDVHFKWDAKNPFLQQETLFASFKNITAELSDKTITSSLVYRLSQLKDAVLVDGITPDQIVSMFAYEVKHSFPHTADTKLAAKRLAGLCLPESDKAYPGDTAFNPEAPVIAHFLSGVQE